MKVVARTERERGRGREREIERERAPFRTGSEFFHL
jgi:hypothetical protein